MAVRLIRFLRGHLCIRLTGNSPERFFNLCKHAGISLWDIRASDAGYVCQVSLSSFRRLRPVLKKSGMHIRIIRRTGMPFLLYRYRHHRFFPVGVGCLFILLFLMTQFIWSVEVSGNSKYSGQVLRKFLDGYDIGYGSWKNRIDCEETEALLRQNFDDITWVSVRMSGTRLYIDIQERLKEETISDPDGDELLSGTDLLTDVEGRVVSIVVRKGTPLVSQGDFVEAGTAVVSGAIALKDDSGEVTGYQYCHADADIWIQTTFPYHDTFPQKKKVMQKTGRKRYGIICMFGSWQLQISGRVKQGMIRETTCYRPRIGTDFYLPFQLVVSSREGYQWQEILCSREELCQIAESHLKDYCKNLEKNAIQIQGKSVIIKASATEISVEGSLQVLVKATRQAETEKMKEQEGTGTDGIDTTNVGHSD